MKYSYKLKEKTNAIFDVFFFPIFISVIYKLIINIVVFRLLDNNLYFPSRTNMDLLCIIFLIVLLVLRIKMGKEKNTPFESLKILIIVFTLILFVDNVINAISEGNYPQFYFILGIFVSLLSLIFFIAFTFSKKSEWTGYKESLPKQQEIFNRSFIKFNIFLIVSLSLIFISEIVFLGQIPSFSSDLFTLIYNNNLKTFTILSIVFDLVSATCIFFLTFYFISISKGRSVFNKKRVISIISTGIVISVLNFIINGIITNYYLFKGSNLLDPTLIDSTNPSILQDIKNFEISGLLKPVPDMVAYIFFIVVVVIYLVKISKNTSAFWVLPKSQLPNEIAEIKNQLDIALYINYHLKNREIMHSDELSNTLMLPNKFLNEKILKWILNGVIFASVKNGNNDQDLVLEKGEQTRPQRKNQAWRRPKNEEIQRVSKVFMSNITETSHLIESGRYDEAISELKQIKDEIKSYNIPEITEYADKYIDQAQMLKILLKMFKISNKLKIDDICDQLERPREEIFKIFLDVGEKLGINIDGDYITAENTDILNSMVFNSLEETFKDWNQNEIKKKGKLE